MCSHGIRLSNPIHTTWPAASSSHGNDAADRPPQRRAPAGRMCGIDHARDRRARRAVVHAIEDATDRRRIAPTRRHDRNARMGMRLSPMSSDGKWTTADVPDQSGRVAIVTGANTGIGYHTAAALAQTGAHVVLAVRNLEKGNLALARIVAAHPRRRRHAAGTGPQLAGLGARRRRPRCARPTRASTC